MEFPKDVLIPQSESIISGMPLKLSPTNTAFFICDIQPSLIHKVYYAEEIVLTTAFLLDVARVLEVPCVATEQYPEKLKHTSGVLSFSSLCS